ncbi:MAG: 30S ribosomal protein S8 [Candidatus Margulisiibacteriota bacterium]|jgi:small subunit ribosomal protein S8
MDVVGDLLIRIKNAISAGKDGLDLPHSRMKESIVKLLFTEGYISKYDSFKRLNRSFLRIALKYNAKKKSVIRGIKRVSTPGKRIYIGKDRMPRVQSGFGTAIVSTSKGVMTDDEARKNKVGGELLCLVW